MSNSEDHKDEAPGHNKDTIIYVNTIEVNWQKKEISFEELVAIAFPDSAGKEFDVTYAKGESDQMGQLLNGKTVNVHPKMEFIVTATNES